jgi:AcrR family transcriptional regulator
MKVNDELVQQRLLETARELLAKKGLRGWNMDQLARAAGLTKPTLYKMIGSKEKLLETVILGQIHEMQSRMLEIIRGGEDYLEILDRMLRAYPDFFRTAHTDYMQEVLLEFPAIDSKVLAHADSVTEQLVTFFRGGIAMGRLRSDVEPELILELVRAVVHYAVTSGKEGADRADTMQRMLSILRDGVISPS